MPPSSGNRRAIALTYLICMWVLFCLPTTVVAIGESDPTVATGAPETEGYDDLLSPDRKIRQRAFGALYDQIFMSGEVTFDFLANSERLVATLEEAASGADKELAVAATYVFSQIAMAGGNKKFAETRGMAFQDSALSGPYQQFDKFGVNDTLTRLATEAEGKVQEHAVLAIFYQDVMSEKNDDLIIGMFRSANTDDDPLRSILFALIGSVYDMPGSSGKKRPISSELAKALYELLHHEELPVRRSASKVLAHSDSENARDVVIEGLFSGANDEVFEYSLQILTQHDSDDLKQDPRHADVIDSLDGESRKKAYSDFLRSLE